MFARRLDSVMQIDDSSDRQTVRLKIDSNCINGKSFQPSLLVSSLLSSDLTDTANRLSPSKGSGWQRRGGRSRLQPQEG